MEWKMDYTTVNSKIWDFWAQNGSEWSVPVSHEVFVQAKAGVWGVYLTPCKTVPQEWFGEIEQKRLLGLASGGGQQMPVFAALGAVCTVFDYSAEQLERERTVAQREGYEIEIVKGDMSKTLPFADGSFDLIFHPVSNCYVEDVNHIWRECYRFLRPGGILLAGFDNGLNYLFDDNGTLPLTVVNRLPFNPIRHGKEFYEQEIKRGEGIQFSHTMEEQIGGQLKAGFHLTDLYEDRDRPGRSLIREFAPQYIATRAIKK